MSEKILKKMMKKKVQVVVIADQALLLLEFSRHFSGFQNVTGAVEDNETFLVAAARELFEETKINFAVVELNIEFTFFDRWKNHCFEKVFLCCLPTLPTIILSEEHQSYKWISLDLVQPSNYVFPSNYQAFLAARKYLSENKQ